MSAARHNYIIMWFNGVFELEGAGTSLLNSVSDSSMCPTENGHFFTLQVNISVSVHVLEHFFISSRLFLSIFLSLFLPFFFFTHFSLFPLIFFSFFFFLLSSVLCPTLFLCPTPGPSREGPEGPPNTPLDHPIHQ